jgi:tetratricopeptide (TPR) repeat protein
MLRATGKPGTIAYGLVGIVLGLSAIARPNILFFVPAVLVWLVIMYPKQRLRAMRYAISLVLGCLIMLLPITLRNYIVGDDVVLIASQGGVNFYIGNNPLSNGWKAIVPGTPGDWWGGYYAVINRAEQARGRPLKPSEVSQYYYNESLDFMMEQPGRFLTLMLHKLRLFWSRWEIPNNKDLYFWTETFTPIVKWLPLKFMVVGPLGLVGLILCWRRAVKLFPLWGFILVYMVSVVLFFCTARYRLPILAPLILLAVHGLFWCFDSFRRASWKGVLHPLALLVPAVLLVCIGTYPGGKGTKALSFRTLAQAYSKQGRSDLAVESYREALKIIPDFLAARYNLASELAYLGRTSEAIEQFRIAVRTTPRHELSETHTLLAAAHDSLGFHLSKSGEHDEAIEHFREAISLNPEDTKARARIHLATSLAAIRNTKEAIDAFREALRVNPNLQSAHYQLAILLLEEDKHEEAIHHFQETLRIKPDNISALCSLGQAFIEQNLYTEAINYFKEALRIKPDYAKAHNNIGIVLFREGKIDEAIKHFKEALRIRPNYNHAHNNLKKVLESQRKN